MKCNKCGAESNPDTKFCRGCGTKHEPPFPSVVVSAAPVTAIVTETAYSPPPVPPSAPQSPVQAMQEPAPMPYVSTNATGIYQPALANPAKTKMVFGVVAAMIALSGIGGGGYWYYQKVETEKAIALQRQQEEEQRLKEEAEASAEEARQLAAQNARLEAEKRASEERQRLQAQMQQQEREADRREQQLQAQLQQQQREAEQRLQQMQAQRSNQQSSVAHVRLENKNCAPQYIFVDSKLVVYLGTGLSQSIRTSIGRHTVKSCSDMRASSCGSTGNPYWQSTNESYAITCN